MGQFTMSPSGKIKRNLNFSKCKLEIMKISDLSLIVECPSEIDMNEWMSVHLVQFYNELSLLCSIIRHDNVICNEQSCPKMCVSAEYEYFWHSKEFIQPIAVSAPKYIDFLMEWIEQIIQQKIPKMDAKNDEDENDQKQYEFPSNFRSTICKIFR